MLETLKYVLYGTGFTFLLTALGASSVLFLKSEINARMQRCFLGFAAGVMLAASIFSLIIPAMEAARQNGTPEILPVAAGFLCGWLFLVAMDFLLKKFHPAMKKSGAAATRLKQNTMLVFAITLHNFPEGLAVGLAFALAAKQTGQATLAAAITLALGIGIQNFPEGAAISLPLRQKGMSRGKAFLIGALSGLAEPAAGLLAVFMLGAVTAAMPWALSFAAGAMVYVTVDELIPEASFDKTSRLGTTGTMLGFLIMMFLDIALG